MHIHIPDGVLPVWLWLTGYVIVCIFLIFILPGVRKEVKKIPLVGMLGALALSAMSIPLGLPIHLNLMVLIGVLIGARWSLVLALILNFILASFGHGGLTIVGLNTLVLWSQAVLGILLFRTFVKVLKNYFISASLATFFALFISFLLVFGIVAISQINPAEFLYDHEETGQGEVESNKISLSTFFLLASPVALFGAIIESIITGFIIQFLRKVKPAIFQ